jgi:tetratricopeptide (TPR) repeat protein/S1-C subfamily serine protease
MVLRNQAAVLAALVSISSLTQSTSFATPPESTTSLADRIKKIRSSSKEVSSESPASVLMQNPVYTKAIKGVVFVSVKGKDGSTWQGTGWVLDKEQRLVVTNHHVIEDAEDFRVFFPLYVDGQLVTDLGRSLVDARAIAGRIVDSDEGCDLALLQVDSIPQGYLALELADKSATPGQRVHSIAGNTVGSQSLWTYSTGYVRQILMGELANGGTCMMLESDMATNQGNSGGPVCDDEGRVVAVVEGHATDARLVSMYIDLQALTDYLHIALRCVDPKKTEDFHIAAERHLADDRPDAALKLATAAVKHDPESADCLALRGRCWLALEDDDNARGDFEDALELDARCSEAHAGLGEIAWNEDEFDEAVQYYSNAIRHDSANAKYLVGRGEIRSMEGYFDEARKDFRSALKLDPKEYSATRGIGFIDVRDEEFATGCESLLSVLDHFRDDAEIHCMIGIALNGMGDRELAVDYWNLALGIDESHVESHFELGRSKLHSEELEEATQHLAIAAENWDEDAMAQFLYGVALFGGSNFDEAEEYFEAALELDPDDEEIAKGVSGLRKIILEAQSED